jgi:hypothetical protein
VVTAAVVGATVGVDGAETDGAETDAADTDGADTDGAVVAGEVAGALDAGGGGGDSVWQAVRTATTRPNRADPPKRRRAGLRGVSMP